MLYSRIVAVAALASSVSALPLSSRTIVAASDVITISVDDMMKRDLALDLANDKSYYSRRDDPVEVEPRSPDNPSIDPGFIRQGIRLHISEDPLKM